MKVNLQIEEDDQFRNHVKSLIEGQVRHILREQLQGVIAGEIAKLRLLQPNSTTIGDMVAIELRRHTASKVTAADVSKEVSRLVAIEVANQVKPLSQQVKDIVAKTFANQLNQ